MVADHEAVAERFGGALGHALIEQDLGEAVAKRRAGEGACQDADEGDADLDRRQEPSGILRQPEGGGGARASAVGHRLQAGLAGRDDGQLGQCEETVQADQKESYAEFEQGVFRCAWHRSEVVNVAAAAVLHETRHPMRTHNWSRKARIPAMIADEIAARIRTLPIVASQPMIVAMPSRSRMPSAKAAMAKAGGMLPNGIGRKRMMASRRQAAPTSRSGTGWSRKRQPGFAGTARRGQGPD